MKTVITVCFCLLITVMARADFTMPDNAYRMPRLEEAKAEAKLNGRAITIIFTHEKTSCGLCKAASLKAAETLGKATVVVYANADNEWHLLPTSVQMALDSPEAGRFVPKVVILDPELNTVFAIVPYAESSEYVRRLNDAIKRLPAALAKSATETN